MDKTQLITAINFQLNEKLNELSIYSDDLMNSLQREEKSTAGDKHDTGRAMIHLEQEKLQNQLKETKTQIQRIKSLEQNKNNTKTIDYGSFVKTTGPFFLIGIGLGKITSNKRTVFCIGIETPIGKQLKGLKKDDCFDFIGKTEKIISIT